MIESVTEHKELAKQTREILLKAVEDEIALMKKIKGVPLTVHCALMMAQVYLAMEETFCDYFVNSYNSETDTAAFKIDSDLLYAWGYFPQSW